MINSLCFFLYGWQIFVLSFLFYVFSLEYNGSYEIREGLVIGGDSDVFKRGDQWIMGKIKGKCGILEQKGLSIEGYGSIGNLEGRIMVSLKEVCIKSNVEVYFFII